MAVYSAVDEVSREAANRFLAAQWGSTCMAVRGQLFDLSGVPGFAAWEDGQIIALITYDVRGDVCEILSLDSLRENQGVGSTLLDFVVRLARTRGCQKLTLVTTNDNTRAIRFYQKRGFDLSALDRDAVARARSLKPSIPMTGCDGIPIRHELTFEMDVR